MTHGYKTGGRAPGVANKVTVEFKEALNAFLTYAAPNMVGWLERVAADDPNKALDHVSRLAEYVHPKLARTDNTTKLEGGLNINIVRFSDLNKPASE